MNHEIDPHRLANLLLVGQESDAAEWPRADWAALLVHQMNSPVTRHHQGLTKDELRDEPDAASTGGEAKRLLWRDLLNDPKPSPKQLEQAKSYIKMYHSDPAADLPRQIATALYYALIAAGLVRLDQRITHLEDRHLREGFEWGIEQDWMDAQLRALFHLALQKIERGRDY